jgi:hypothetical protein
MMKLIGDFRFIFRGAPVVHIESCSPPQTVFSHTGIIDTYPRDIKNYFLQRVAVEVRLLRWVLHVNNVQELESVDNRITATYKQSNSDRFRDAEV